MVYLALDFGGTRTRAAYFDEHLTLQARHEVLTHASDSIDVVINRIITTARHVLPPGATPTAVGMAAPGPLDASNGVILHAETLPGWHDIPLGRSISEAFGGAPVFIQNDANIAALAESQIGAAQGKNPVIYLTLSTGIGGGVVIDGQLFTGSAGLAAEPGHQVFRLPDGSVKKLEELASGTALGQRTTAYLAANSYLQTSLPRNVPLTGQTVGEAALNGDPFAQSRVEEAAEWLGLGLVNLIHLFNPQMIVLGGSVTRVGDLLLTPIQRVVQANILSPRFLATDWLQLAALGDDVCLIGAAYYAHTRFTRES